MKQSTVISWKNLKCFNVHKDTRIFLFSSAGCVHCSMILFLYSPCFDLCSPKIFRQSSKLFRRSRENQFLWLRISFKKVSSPSQTNINGISLLLKYVTFLKSLRDLAFSLMLRKNLIFLNKTKAPAVPPSYYHNNTVWEKVVSNNDCSQTK